ncbi:MAG: ComEC/Rec2 family competence protein [Caldilineaceae bacterium]|nr:ComEC/Rec2 family competence protein [Caldilineaceae bacterium]
MKLLYLAIAYLLGVAAGQILWKQGWFGCGIGDHFWIASLVLVCGCLWMDANSDRRTVEPMRWLASAGFSQPRGTFSAWFTCAIVLTGICGFLRLGSHTPQPCPGPSDLAYYNLGSGESISRVTVADGYVASYPTLADGRQWLDISVESVEVDGHRKEVKGRLRLQTTADYRFRFGEGVRVKGQLMEPPVFEGFDYRAYLARKQIHSLMVRPHVEIRTGPTRGGLILQFVYGIRSRGERMLNRLLPEPYAGLASGMLLGIEAGIPEELYEKFNLTGTSHVIVISGSNVALVTGAMMGVGIWLFGRRGALWPTLGGLALYTLLVGADAAVMRAALMGGLFVIATVLGRQGTALVSLAAACWLMTLWNPLMLWDVGFQLSSAATVGLILMGPALLESFKAFWNKVGRGLRRRGAIPEGSKSDFLRPNSVGDLLRDALLTTVAASIATYPLIVFYFGRLSLISLLSNLLIAPAQPGILIFGGLALVVGLSGLEQLARLLLFIPYAGLWWTTTVVNWSASIRGASVEVDWFGGGAAAFTYAGILGLYWRKAISGYVRMLWRRTVRTFARHRGGVSTRRQMGDILVATPTWMFGAFSVVAGMLWWMAMTQPDGQLHVHFLDVGQGDGIFIQTPSGRQLLIDGGDDSQRLFAELGEVMPFWDREIDYAIVTHPDWDHVGGQTDLPERFRIGHALISENTRGHEDSKSWLAAFHEAEVPVEGLQQGGWLDLGDGVALWALWPPPEEALHNFEEHDKNERSLILKLVYGEFTVLLTGDAGQPSEERLLRGGRPLAAHVLKVGHHGSEHSSGKGFVEAVGPSVAVIQVGAENRYGHPDREVLEILDGRLVLRNDLEGRIHIWSDGKLMWIWTESGAVGDLIELSGAATTVQKEWD